MCGPNATVPAGCWMPVFFGCKGEWGPVARRLRPEASGALRRASERHAPHRARCARSIIQHSASDQRATSSVPRIIGGLCFPCFRRPGRCYPGCRWQHVRGPCWDGEVRGATCASRSFFMPQRCQSALGCKLQACVVPLERPKSDLFPCFLQLAFKRNPPAPPEVAREKAARLMQRMVRRRLITSPSRV